MRRVEEPSAASLVHEALVTEGFELDASQTQYSVYRGKLDISSVPREIEIHFKDENFIKLPKLKVLDGSFIQRSVGHFLGDYYCYANDGENIFDKYNPRGAVRSWLNMIREALQAHLERDLVQDISGEFPQHWNANISCFIEAEATGDRMMELVRVENDAGKFVTCVEVSAQHSHLGKVLRKKSALIRPVRLLEFEGELTFFGGDRPPRTLQELVQWARKFGDKLDQRLMGAFGYARPGQLTETVFIRARNAIIGVRIVLPKTHAKLFEREKAFSKLLKNLADKIEVERWSTEQISQESLFRRNIVNFDMNLSGKTVALIGCGTIGGYLSKMLAQSGGGSKDGKLALIDNEKLRAENVGRHFLGPNRIGQNKAKACAEEIQRLYPLSNVKGLDAEAIQTLDDLTQFDLIIDATGEEALSIAINEWLKHKQDEADGPHGLFVWLFGNAFAAQSLLVLPDEYACYKCLKPRHADSWRYDPLLNNIEIEQHTGPCGEAPFFPYGVGGSVIAAGLACNAVIDWTNNDFAPRLRSIQIDASKAKNLKDVNPSKSKACPVCSTLGQTNG